MPGVDTVIQVLSEVLANKGVSAPTMQADTALDRTFPLDSLDYAEVVVRLDAEFGSDPFSSANPPTVSTIAELANAYADAG